VIKESTIEPHIVEESIVNNTIPAVNSIIVKKKTYYGLILGCCCNAVLIGISAFILNECAQ
tara:strand:+ start:883 stop:1065 length:183 start_codon:yes stop_codon:yes gene_type:complete